MTEVARVRAGSTGGRVAVWVQLSLLIVYLIGSYGVLLAAVVHKGDPAAVFDPGLERLGDPKDSIPPVGPQSVWNPLFWVFGLGRLLAFLVFPAAFVAVVLGLGFITRTWLVGDRKRFGWLVVGTGLWLVVAVVALTPYGRHLQVWLLD